jgi:hypothetical protein
MKIRIIRWLLLGLFVFWLLMSLAFSTEERTLGLSVEWRNGGYRFAGGTEPAALLFAVLWLGAYAPVMGGEEVRTGAPSARGFPETGSILDRFCRRNDDGHACAWIGSHNC